MWQRALCHAGLYWRLAAHVSIYALASGPTVLRLDQLDESAKTGTAAVLNGATRRPAIRGHAGPSNSWQECERKMPDILMATYNGGSFIQEQIESLLTQTRPDWRLLIRDDGSTDQTVSICGQYAARFPGRIVVIKDGLGQLGSTGNFNRLLRESDAEYSMFCDQDDVWLPDKIEKTLSAMHKLEGENSVGTPLLVFTDTTVVNEKLELISNSLLQYLGRTTNVKPHQVLLESPANGNTIMINKPLRELVSQMPKEVVYHDVWFTLAAAVFGKLSFVNQATILWRRHSVAVGGVKNRKLSRYLSVSFADHRKYFYRRLGQCALFYNSFGQQMNDQDKSLFAAASQIPQVNWIMRRYLLIRHRMLPPNFRRSAGLLLAI